MGPVCHYYFLVGKEGAGFRWLVLLLVALWFILRGDLFYVLPCIILFLNFFSPFSIAITSLGEERAILSAFRTFVRFALVWFCLFPLPLGVWEGLRFVIVALPGLFSYFLQHILLSDVVCIRFLLVSLVGCSVIVTFVLFLWQIWNCVVLFLCLLSVIKAKLLLQWIPAKWWLS